MSSREWDQIPVRIGTKQRVSKLRGIKANKKPREHTAETFDDVVVRLLDFYEENQPSVSRDDL